jgi:hypothetical protein
MTRHACRRFVVAMMVAVPLAAPMSGQSAKTNGPAKDSAIEGTDLARMLRRDTQNLMLRKTARGGMQVDLDGGFRSVLVVRVGPDGKPHISCIASEREAEKFFAQRKDTQKEKP